MVIYPLPVDTPEEERYNAQHELLRRELGANYFGSANIRTFLRSNHDPGQHKHAVDLGSGNGRWAEEMAAEFPDVQFDAVDIVPVVTENSPTNVHRVVADFNARLPYEDSSVDLVHVRQMILGIADYAALLRECGRILRPGGLFLSAEWSYYVVHNTAPDQSSARFPHLTRFYDILGDMVEQRNHHLRTERIPDFIMESGLFDVLLDVGYPIPAGTWNPQKRELGLHVAMCTKRFVRHMKGMFVGAGWTSEDYDDLANKVEEEFDTKPEMIIVYNCVSARKKETPA